MEDRLSSMRIKESKNFTSKCQKSQEIDQF